MSNISRHLSIYKYASSKKSKVPMMLLLVYKRLCVPMWFVSAKRSFSIFQGHDFYFMKQPKIEVNELMMITRTISTWCAQKSIQQTNLFTQKLLFFVANNNLMPCVDELQINDQILFCEHYWPIENIIRLMSLS